MSQLSIFTDDNLRSNLLRLIKKEKEIREWRLRISNNNGSFGDYSKGYLDCLSTIERINKCGN